MRRLASLFRDSRGNVLILTALSAPLLMGSAGLALDTVQWSLWKRQLQRLADSAATAGAYARGQSKDVTATVTSFLTTNQEVTLTGSPVIENAPTSGGFSGDNRAVRVRIATKQPLPFSGMFLSTAPTITATATAAMITNGNHCVIALDKSTATGIAVQGNATLDLRCGMASNTSGSNAISAGGSSSVIATPLTAVGGLLASSSYKSPTKLEPYSLPQPDPFAALPTPTASGCANKVTVSPNQSVALTPGCYKGMDLKGTVTLSPGTYVIDGSSLDFGSQAHVTGTGVTFILTSATAATQPSTIATLDFNGGATLNLTAPTSGTYAGVLIYQDRRAPTSGVNKINGNASSKIQGALYFPSQTIEFTGTSGMNTECLQMVGWHVNFSGNSSIINNCPVGSGSQSFIGTRVRLVE